MSRDFGPRHRSENGQNSLVQLAGPIPSSSVRYAFCHGARELACGNTLGQFDVRDPRGTRRQIIYDA